MKEAAVIGSPISHSLSPAIFSFLARRSGMSDFTYKAREVPSSQLQSVLIEYRRTQDFVGVNVTVPHKQMIFSELDAVTPEAKEIGAVNVIHADDHHLFGYNTDLQGILRTLANHPCEVKGESVWIFGAGGAARAVAYAMGKLGAKTVYISNRNSVHTETLIKDMGKTFPHTVFTAEGLTSVPHLSLVVNATSVGMKSISPPLTSSEETLFEPLRRLPFRPNAVAFDLIYNPEKTPFLTIAETLGLSALGGLEMLVEQALATWEIWFGANTAVREMKPALTLHLRGLLNSGGMIQARPLFLTGFMGSGKSSVGAILARKMGWDFVDSDQWIEAEAGLSIPKIFEARGEDHFRELENKIVLQACLRSKTVVSLGGGALMNPESLETIEKSGFLVYLSATPETLLERVQRNAANRPLLAGLDSEGQATKIKALLEARTPIYNRASLRVDTDRKTHGEIAELILEQLSWEKS